MYCSLHYTLVHIVLSIFRGLDNATALHIVHVLLLLLFFFLIELDI